MKKYILILIGFLFSLNLSAQNVQWVDLEEAFELQKSNPKPILIDVYTNWCGWCKHMEATTYKDPQIVNYLNANFYAVKYNAETHDTIVINDKRYVNNVPKGSKGTHEFARETGVKSYPTTLLYDKNGQNQSLAAGALTAEQIAPLLVFFGEHLVNLTNVNTFSDDFKRTFRPDSTQLQNTSNVEWYEINEGIALAKKEKKKLWIQTYEDNCLTCKVMDSTIYKNEFLSSYINENYVAIKFNAKSTENIELQGKIFANPNSGLNGYHQLFSSALNGQEVKSPALLIFDENEQLIVPVRSFLNVKYAEALAVYFAENKNKENIDFGTFIQSHSYQSVK